MAGLLKVTRENPEGIKSTYLPKLPLLLFTRESSILGNVLDAGEGQESESEPSFPRRVRAPSGCASWVKKDRTMSSMHRTTEGEFLQENLVNKNKYPLLVRKNVSNSMSTDISESD